MKSFYILFFSLLCLCFTDSILASESTCPKDQFFCRLSDSCIPNKLRCNGKRDCEYGEDEFKCSCALRCDDGNTCLMRRQICDGKADCVDKADETNCSTVSCSHDKFLCRRSSSSSSSDQSPECVDLLLKCNGVSDCFDGSDEDDCLPQKLAPKQPCSAENLCDGFPNCDADEPKFCPSRSDDSADLVYSDACPLSASIASSFRLARPGANVIFRRCDTFLDCPLGEDEKDCNNAALQQQNCGAANESFRCASGAECVHISSVCDGLTQCSDGSDEFVINCLRKFDGRQPEAAYPDESCLFRCRLPTLSSLSTELDSSSSNINNRRQERDALSLPFSKFCISVEQVCDGANDCPLGDDEDRVAHGCPDSGESRYASQKCTFQSSDAVGNLADGVESSALRCDPVSTDCIVSPAFGPTCVCKPGFRPTSEAVNRCVDIDECATGVCEHYCENLIGSYACGCSEGFHLPAGEKGCTQCEASFADDEPYFIFSTPKSIYRLDKASDMTKTNLFHVANELQSRPTWAGAIPFDYARTDDLLVYYNWGAIYGRGGGKVAEPWLFLNVEHDVSWIAYDDISNNVYFNGKNDIGYSWKVFYIGVLRERGRVTSASRSSGVKTVVRSEKKGVTASNLVLYPETGLMFFMTLTEKESDRVVASTLNGEDLKTFPWKFKLLRSLSIDRSNGFLYVFDAGRPGIGHVPILTDSSPATVGDLKWIEERRSFFGPKPFIQFASGEFSSDFYFLTGQFDDNGVFKTSFQTFNKSSMMAFESSVASPFTVISAGSLLTNTSFFRVRSVARPLQLDACFHERTHNCDLAHICLPRPPPPGITSALTRPICECPDDASGCKRVVLDIRRDFYPPGRPAGSLDEFRERAECSNLVKPTKKPKSLQQQQKPVDVRDLDNLGTWPVNLSSYFNSDYSFSRSNFEALTSDNNSAISAYKIAPSTIMTFLFLTFLLFS